VARWPAARQHGRNQKNPGNRGKGNGVNVSNGSRKSARKNTASVSAEPTTNSTINSLSCARLMTCNTKRNDETRLCCELGTSVSGCFGEKKFSGGWDESSCPILPRLALHRRCCHTPVIREKSQFCAQDESLSLSSPLMTVPAFIYTSEPWAARSFGRPIFRPIVHA
jgi:hypothetical protein